MIKEQWRLPIPQSAYEHFFPNRKAYKKWLAKVRPLYAKAEWRLRDASRYFREYYRRLKSHYALYGLSPKYIVLANAKYRDMFGKISQARLEKLLKKPPSTKRFCKRDLTAICLVAGLRRTDAMAVADTWIKWFKSSGDAWTNSRIKELRLWYEKYLAGESYNPQWFRKTKAGIPKGPLGCIFRLPVEKGLLVLSANTLLFGSSEETEKKFRKALCGNGYVLNKDMKQHVHDIFNQIAFRNEKVQWKDYDLRMPVPEDVPYGKSVSIQDGEAIRLIDGDEVTRALAYSKSWESLPQCTVDFLEDMGHLDWLPVNVAGDQWQLSLTGYRDHQVGVIGTVNEPQMKRRNPAMLNPVIQALLRPLGEFWYDRLRCLRQDCTFDQAKGVRWIQQKLREGVKLASVDMTSASDLLDLDACLEVVNTTYFHDTRWEEDYSLQVQHFHDISRGKWYYPVTGEFVKWDQGQPLGSFPSFALMALTNNALCMLACYLVGIPTDMYCVLGDDVIIDARAADMYCHLVQLIGGEINTLKTVTSSKLVEFAGRVITVDTHCNKAVNLALVSDDSFLSYAAMLGPSNRIKKFLRPDQRKVWKELKYVPGILEGYPTVVTSDLPSNGKLEFPPVNGPWSRDSYGEPLSVRYEWFLSCILPLLTRPDLLPLQTVEESLRNNLEYALDPSQKFWELQVPWAIAPSDYQSEVRRKIPSGDPRKWNQGGKSMLEILMALIESPQWVSFRTFKASLLRQAGGPSGATV